MRRITYTLAALAAAPALGFGVTACGGSPAGSHPARTATARQAATPRAPAASTAPAALPRGPFRITVVHCGRFSAAQRSQFPDESGIIFRYVNMGTALTAPEVMVEFLQGNTVVAEGKRVDLPLTEPGQAAYGDTPAINDAIQPVPFTSCRILYYTVRTAQGDQPGTYAP
jgi:hypothetical protein